MSRPGEPGDEIPQCTARSSRSGERCRNRPVRGATVCSTHGGSAPQVKAAAERRQAEQQASAEVRRLLHDVDADPITDPVLALQRLAGRLEAALDHLGDKVNQLQQLEADTSGRARVEAQMWLHVARELRQALEAMARLGIEDRVTAVLEAQGEQVFELIQAVGRLTLASLVQLLAEQPAALELVEAGFERVFAEAARAELGRAHELEVGGAA